MLKQKGTGSPSGGRGKRKNFKLAASLLLCAGAAVFYWVVAVASNPTAVPAQTPSQTAVSSLTPSSEAPPSSAESSAVPAASGSDGTQQVALQDASQPLWVKVDIAAQRVFVYDAENRVVQDYVCSTGAVGADTPVGTYTVQERGESFFSKQYQEGAYYWTRFKGSYLFHSVPFDKNQKMEEQEAQKLGTKASHGCVRLSIENAKWIYEHLPRGTKVVIQ